MKGRNELHFCPATMIEAVQEYLEGQFAGGKAPIVQSVHYAASNGSQTFVVTVVDKVRPSGEEAK